MTKKCRLQNFVSTLQLITGWTRWTPGLICVREIRAARLKVNLSPLLQGIETSALFERKLLVNLQATTLRSYSCDRWFMNLLIDLD